MNGTTVRRLAADHYVWMLLALVCVFFAFLSPHFLTAFNIGNVLTQSAFIGLLAIGMTLVILNGEIDLSVGATLALSAALAIGLQNSGWPTSAAIAAGLLAGTALGFINGAVVVASGMHSFVVTLGALIGIRGLVFVYTKGNALLVEDFTYADLLEVYVGPVSLTAIIFLGMLAFFQWLLSASRHGREAYAVGDNPEAARDAGVRVGRHKIINFTISGFLAALCGILLSIRLGTAEPQAGRIWELWTIIAVVLGGTRLQGGVGSLWKTLGGVLVLAVLQNGLRLLNTPNHVELIVMGVILMIALGIDRLMTLLRERERTA
ncbi:ABC transporter permease [Shinella sp.]|uniref:ABC transporter permease n=1 Tax=Shinella sp. TaxID=1870904 RepID=UPI0039E236B7